ncbi:MAG: hypothetical protein JKY54_15710, partial [Flavobacteriales bacterium]|nr:hypothetical protein [Flavobacteriales bacterium]
MNNTIKLLATTSCLAILLFSCKKENPTPVIPSTPSPSTIDSYIHGGALITASFGVSVLDENGLPIDGATVIINTITKTTNILGLAMFTNISTGDDRTYVEIQKTGYFNSSKAVNPVSGGMVEIDVEMIPKAIIGSFSSATGGSVSTSEGAQVIFSSSDVANADGSSYTGNVNVSASYLDPGDPNIQDLMPGNLQAINGSGDEVILQTYGMIAVELTGDAGEELNVAPGETVEIRIPLSG